MQLLGIIVSFLMGTLKHNKPTQSLKESALEIFEEVTHRSRRIVMLTLGAVMAVIFVSGGLFYSLIDATTQYDRNGVIIFSSSFLSGIILAIIAGGGFSIIFQRAWPGQKEARQLRQEPAKAHASGGIEEAISLLILDFVKEREERRARRQQEDETPEFKRQRPSESPESPQYQH